MGSILDHSYDGNRSDAFCDHKTEYVAAVDHDGSGDEELPFSVIAQIAVWIRCAAAVILSGGSLIGIFDIGEKTKLDSGYVEQHVYGFAMGEPNTAFLTVFLALLLVLYYNYEKLNVLWCGVTSLIALIFYKMTFCRTGVLVFFFCWVLILFDKVVKSKK